MASGTGVLRDGQIRGLSLHRAYYWGVRATYKNHWVKAGAAVCLVGLAVVPNGKADPSKVAV
jgi:hypothetical protein